jgi:hypothetical protein
MSNNPYVPQFAPFQSGCSMCKPSTDYAQVATDYVQVGSGNYSNDGLIPVSNGKNLYHAKNYEMNLDQTFMKNNLGIDYATSFGGAKGKKVVKPKSKKNQKGGEYGIFNINQQSDESLLSGGKKSKAKKPKKSLKGGDPMAELSALLSMSEKSDKVMSGGKKKPIRKMKGGDPMAELSAFLSMNNKSESVMSGGKKKQSKKPVRKMKGGMESSGATPMDQRFFNADAALLNYPELSGNDVNSAYGSIVSGNVGTGMLAPYNSSSCSSANHNTMLKTGGAKGKKLVRKMKGGMESSGATPMDQRFFNADAALLNYPELSGNGVKSAYGPIVSGNVGTGMLAPYNSSSCSSANHNTMLKTGGAKGKKPVSKKPTKKMIKKGGDGPIPKISDAPVSAVSSKVDGAINGFSSFMQKLNEDYLKSVQAIKNTKIGNQRLVGGKKAPKKKSVAKKPKAKKMKGGDGSDYAATQGSRGPANAPDAFWGVPGEQWFRQFNKTGDYIPNSKLAIAATPQLVGKGSNEVSGYDEMDFSYGTA